MTPAELAGRLLYRDGLILIIDKPAGLPVHAGPRGGANLEALFGGLKFGLPRPPALAHRLDRDTSGCLVLGRHRKALARLGRLFAEGRVEKTYWAIVEGAPPEPAGRIELALKKRTPTQGGWHMAVDPAGQPAVTDYRLLGSAGGRSWLELKPRTGRTHQIRVHLAALGCPVLGDSAYGAAGPQAPLHLHARALALPLYPGKAPLTVEAPPPAHMLAALAACGYRATAPADAAPPERIDGPAAWYGPDMAARRDWLEELTPAEIAEVEAATARAAESGSELAHIAKEDFPLPQLAPRLARILGDVLDGRGFALIRGLPIECRDIRRAAIAFLGLGSHLGPLRPQNAKGHVLGHVADLGLKSDDPNVRIYQTHERQTFHTDSADIVALLCLRGAKSGGLSSLVSSVTIYNEMRRRRPDLADVLFAPIETDRRGEVPAGARPYFRIPVFNWHAGRLSAIYQRQYIDSARRFPDVPPLSAPQVEALDLFDALANDPALAFNMAFQPGDVQLVHNHTLLHDRTQFEDWPEPERRRHLLRLWLAPLEARPLPAVFAERYGTILPGVRGGVSVPGLELTTPLEAC